MSHKKKTDGITAQVIIDLYEKEKKLSWVALELNISVSTLNRLIKELDVKLDKYASTKVDMLKYKLPENSFLEVLEENGRDRQGRVCWKCKCICGNILNKVAGKYLRNGDVKSCGCFDRGYGDIVPGYFYSGTKKRAMNRGIDWELSYQFLCSLYKEQNGLCALTGRKIEFSKNKKEYIKYRTTTASIDRRNSDMGYTEDNVQWIHKNINKLKSNLSQEEFFNLCQEVTDWRRNAE